MSVYVRGTLHTGFRTVPRNWKWTIKLTRKGSSTKECVKGLEMLHRCLGTGKGARESIETGNGP